MGFDELVKNTGVEKIVEALKNLSISPYILIAGTWQEANFTAAEKLGTFPDQNEVCASNH